MLNAEKAKEMKESGIDISYDDSEQDVDDRRSSSCSSTQSSHSSPQIGKTPGSSRPRTPLVGRRPHKLRFQARLILLKQQHEQSQDAQKTSRKSPQSGSNLKNQSFSHRGDGGLQQIESHRIAANSAKNRIITSYPSHSKGSDCGPSPDFVNSPFSPEAQMKFSLLKTSLSADMGYADDASTTSSTTSISEMSENDQFLLGNVVEVKAVDELPEEISELLCHASYTEGVSELMHNGKTKVLAETSSSCPAETAVQPKYRGGRKKETAPPNMTPEQKVQWDKERQKKDNHNHIERRRRDKINECIRLLAVIVPNGEDDISNSVLGESGSIDSQKKEYNKKGAVLEAAVNYIKRLQSEQKQMEEFRKQQELLQRANRSLMLEIQQLQNRAQQVHITSPHLSPPVQVQQVLLHQYQPQMEPQLNHEHLQQAEMVQLLVAQPSHQQMPEIEIHQHLQQQSQNLFLDEFVNFVQESSSECPPLVPGNCHFDGSQFEPMTETVFLNHSENDFQELSLMDHGFIDIVPDHTTTINDYNVDDFFGGQSVQLNGDPLLSNATDEPMASDFDDLFIPLALR